MSEIVQPAAEPRGVLGARVAGARARLRSGRPPSWLWPVSVLLQAVCAAALTSSTFFFVDDYEFLNQARTQSFGLTYLRGPLYEHFSPVSRLLDKLLVDLAPGSFLLAHGFELVMYVSVLIAFALVVRAILGNSWGAFALTVVFGQSIFLIRLLYWWTATANILPASTFMLLALWCYLRWREVGSRMLLAGSFAAFALSLLDYETAILFPAYVAIISLLVLERGFGPRAWLASLYRERWAWTGYVVLDAAALTNYYSFYYRSSVRPPVPAVFHYLEIALFQTFIPGLLGVTYPDSSPAQVAALVLVAAVGALTLYLRPRAWRCLLAFALVFLITMLPVGLNRIAQFGPGVGRVIYYQQSLQFMFLVLAAFAVSPRWSGRRAAPPFRRLATAAVARRWLAIDLRSRRAVAVAVAVVAGYAALYVTSLRALANETWQARDDSAYVRQYLASVKRVRASTGREPVLIDLTVPRTVLPQGLRHYTSYAVFFALFNSRLRVDAIANPVYIVDPRGRLVPVTFAASTKGLVARASVSATPGPVDVPPPPSGGSAACIPAGRTMSWLHVPLALAKEISVQKNGLSYVLRVHFRMPRTAPVTIALPGVPGYGGIATVTQRWGRGSHGKFIPLGFAGQVREVDFQLPPRACVTQLAFGRLRRQARPATRSIRQ